MDQDISVWNKCLDRAYKLISSSRGSFIHPDTLEVYTSEEELAKVLMKMEQSRLEKGYNSIFPTKEETRKIVPDASIKTETEEPNSDNK